MVHIKLNKLCFIVQQLWVGVLHHVCGDHHWAEGQCQHEPMSEAGEGKQWTDPASTAAETLRDIVFNKQWLKSLSYYVRNRHTVNLEVHVINFVLCVCQCVQLTHVHVQICYA